LNKKKGNIKGKHNFKQFYYIHIVEIPYIKGEHENVQSCPSNEKRELHEKMYKSGTSTLMISGALKPVKTFPTVYH